MKKKTESGNRHILTDAKEKIRILILYDHFS